MRRLTDQSGFTLIEMLVVVTIIALLFAFSAVNLGQSQTDANILTITDTLVADIKNQQVLAMAGAIGSSGTQQPAGVFIQSNQYTTYVGATYSAGDSYNYVTTPPTGISFATTFSGGKLLFNKGAGDVNGFVSGSNTITVSNTAGSKTITVGRFGAVTVL